MSDPLTPNAAKAKIAEAVAPRAIVVRYSNALELLNAWKSNGLSGWIKQQMRPQTPDGSRADAAVSSRSLQPE
jgi:hypothetical protein